MDAPTYASTTTLARASDLVQTPAAIRGMLRHLDAASRDVETLCGGRRFYPYRETRTIDWPSPTGASRSDRIWLDDNELAGAPTALTVAGQAFTGYVLRPSSGPPYRWLEPDDGGSPWRAGATGHLASIAITGPFGYQEQLTDLTTLATAVVSTTAPSLTVSDGSGIGAGDALRIGSEYVIVQGLGWVATDDELASNLTLDSADDIIAVTDGGAYTEGETLRIGWERLLIEEIQDDELRVRRAVEGTAPALHVTTAPLFARRVLVVHRGRLGTTAATHAQGATVERLTPPALVEEYTVGLAMTGIAQDRSGWARTIGQGENEREASGRGLTAMEAKIRRIYGQRGRVAAAGGIL